MIGRSLAHYRVLDKLGSGGMGDVYLAEDTRLDRKVALKVLPAETARDPQRRDRFRVEAKAIASLDHPGIVHAYSVEEADGVHFITMQLVRGRTLRELIVGKGMPPAQFFGIVIPLAQAVAAAHRAHVTHRDLKPENVMLTDDGRVKVLDFGLAKLADGPVDSASEAATSTRLTEAGVVMGTVGYMAPEQVRGGAVGPGADIFALGVIAHEMLSGAAPFRRDTAPETLVAILNDAPPALPASVPPPLDSILRRCLEKSPQARFQSAHDLGLALEALSTEPGAAGARASVPEAAPPSMPRRQVLLLGAGAAVGLATGLGAAALASRRGPAARPSYHSLTFRRGMIRTARFGPDEQTILYGALWDGEACRVYTVRPDNPESAPLDLPPAAPLAVSKSGELALALGDHMRGIMPYGTLARVPLVGGAPREVLEAVKYADWSPLGSELAVVRRVGGRDQLEFPLGQVVAEAPSPAGGLSFPRVSPDGERVAFFELTSNLAGNVVVVDRRTKKRFTSRQYFNAFGLAWNGDEIWFTAAGERPLFRDAILAIREAKGERVVARLPGNASLHDVSPTGRVLMAHTDDRSSITVVGDGAERDLSWLDGAYLADLSRDGTRILFTEAGVGGGPTSSVYLRSTSGAPAVRLGDGWAIALSPDGQWALSASAVPSSPHLDLLPTGAGQARRIERPGVTFFASARWLPDGKRLVVVAQEKDHAPGLYLLDQEKDTFQAITPRDERAGAWSSSPDGSRVALASPRGLKTYSVSGGEPRAVPGPPSQGRLLAWIETGLLVAEDPNPMALGRVYELDPATGRRRLWKDIVPRDPAGVMSMGFLCTTPDGRFYGYTSHRATSKLYLLDGLS